jgi:transposase
VSEPAECGVARCYYDSPYRSRCDLLVGLDGLHVTGVDRDFDAGMLTVRAESPPAEMGYRFRGVVAYSHAAARWSWSPRPAPTGR